MLDNLCVLQYKGGRCAEFLTGYISDHEGVKHYDHVWDEQTNTYNVNDDLRLYLEHLYTVDVDALREKLDPTSRSITSTYYSASSDQLMEKVMLFKRLLPDNGARVALSHSKAHNLFFDCLLMVKHWFKVMPSKRKRWEDEFPECATVEQFLSQTGLGHTGESRFNESLIKLGLVKVLDLDSIFFEQDYSTWLNLLDYFGIEPKPDYGQVFSEYHRRNLTLAQQYSIPLDRNTDDDWFNAWVIKHA